MYRLLRLSWRFLLQLCYSLVSFAVRVAAGTSSSGIPRAAEHKTPRAHATTRKRAVPALRAQASCGAIVSDAVELRWEPSPFSVLLQLNKEFSKLAGASAGCAALPLLPDPAAAAVEELNASFQDLAARAAYVGGATLTRDMRPLQHVAALNELFIGLSTNARAAPEHAVVLPGSSAHGGQEEELQESANYQAVALLNNQFHKLSASAFTGAVALQSNWTWDRGSALLRDLAALQSSIDVLSVAAQSSRVLLRSGPFTEQVDVATRSLSAINSGYAQLQAWASCSSVHLASQKNHTDDYLLHGLAMLNSVHAIGRQHMKAVGVQLVSSAAHSALDESVLRDLATLNADFAATSSRAWRCRAVLAGAPQPTADQPLVGLQRLNMQFILLRKAAFNQNSLHVLEAQEGTATQLPAVLAPLTSAKSSSSSSGVEKAHPPVAVDYYSDVDTGDDDCVDLLSELSVLNDAYAQHERQAEGQATALTVSSGHWSTSYAHEHKLSPHPQMRDLVQLLHEHSTRPQRRWLAASPHARKAASPHSIVNTVVDVYRRDRDMRNLLDFVVFPNTHDSARARSDSVGSPFIPASQLTCCHAVPHLNLGGRRDCAGDNTEHRIRDTPDAPSAASGTSPRSLPRVSREPFPMSSALRLRLYKSNLAASGVVSRGHVLSAC